MIFVKTALALAFAFMACPALATETIIIGDSHVVGSFGESLHNALMDETAKNVRSIGLSGASASTFTAHNPRHRTLEFGFIDRTNKSKIVKPTGQPATVPQLGELLKKAQPSLLIIELGDKLAEYQNTKMDSDAVVTQEVESMMETLKQVDDKLACYWVTPTWTDKSGSLPYRKTNERLAQVIKLIKKSAEPRCTVIDSMNDLGLNSGNIKTLSDGIHYDRANGRIWGKAAAARIIALERNRTGDNARLTSQEKSRGKIKKNIFVRRN